MEIEKFSGTEALLYQAVAPLVMNPDVLRQNKNYPFKTSVHHIWFVAFEEGETIGFLPVEVGNKSAVINNYYIAGRDEEVLAALLEEVAAYFEGKDQKVQAVVQTEDLKVFEKHCFEIIRAWKVYVKMELRRQEDNA